MEAATARVPAARPLESGWRRSDRLFVGLCWATGILLCLIAGSLVLYMLFRGLQYVSVDLLTTHPVSDLDQSKTGGFLDPLIGTVILAVMGTLIALPLGVGAAVWLTEYGRPAWLARSVESGIEMVAGSMRPVKPASAEGPTRLALHTAVGLAPIYRVTLRLERPLSALDQPCASARSPIFCATAFFT